MEILKALVSDIQVAPILLCQVMQADILEVEFQYISKNGDSPLGFKSYINCQRYISLTEDPMGKGGNVTIQRDFDGSSDVRQSATSG